jgi:prolipoprotein diacylglyceryltransferase
MGMMLSAPMILIGAGLLWRALQRPLPVAATPIAE